MPTTSINCASFTMITSAAATLNYGARADGQIDSGYTNNDRILVYADLSSIPTNSVVVGATLSVYFESSVEMLGTPVGAHRALTQWFEGTKDGEVPGASDGSTWAKRNANSGGVVNWGSDTAGGKSGTDYTAIATDIINGGADSSEYFSWDVTPDVRAFVLTPASNFGWWLIATANTDQQVWTSDDGTNKPYVTVSYHTPDKTRMVKL